MCKCKFLRTRSASSIHMQMHWPEYADTCIHVYVYASIGIHVFIGGKKISELNMCTFEYTVRLTGKEREREKTNARRRKLSKLK